MNNEQFTAAYLTGNQDDLPPLAVLEERRSTLERLINCLVQLNARPEYHDFKKLVLDEAVQTAKRQFSTEHDVNKLVRLQATVATLMQLTDLDKMLLFYRTNLAEVKRQIHDRPQPAKP